MKIRNSIALILVFILLFMTSAFAAPKADFELSSESAVLFDTKSGQLLYSKNHQKIQYPAGLTKIVAALIAIEEGTLDNLVTVDSAPLESIKNTSTIGLFDGEVLTLREIIYGMILQSANDCAITAALNICDTTDEFVKKMNDKVKEIGAKNTKFTNVTGIYDKENYSTAEDMALIMQYACENPTFTEIASTKKYTLPVNNKVSYERPLTSKCALISDSSYAYDGVKAGMAGFTEEGNYTTAVSATKNGFDVICVTMNSEGEFARYNDIKKLLDYAFDNFHTIVIENSDLKIPQAKLKGWFGKIGIVDFSLKEPVTLTVPLDADIDNLTYDYQINKKYKKADKYTASVGISFENEKITNLNLSGVGVKKITFYNILKTILLIILIVVLLFIALFFYFIFDSERKKRKRKQDKLKRSLGIKKDI